MRVIPLDSRWVPPSGLGGTARLTDRWKKEINELPLSSNKTSIICVDVAQFVTQDFVRLI